MKKLLITVFGAVILGVIAFVLYRQQALPQKPDDEKASVPENIPQEEYYFNESYRYSIRLPEEMKMEEISPFSMHMIPKEQKAAQGPANLIYISVVPATETENEGEIYGYKPEGYKKLKQMNVGDRVTLADPDQKELDDYFTYTRVEDALINGTKAQVYENKKPWEFPAGTTETRYIFEINDTIYILGSFTGSTSGTDAIDPQTAFTILQTFSIGSS